MTSNAQLGYDPERATCGRIVSAPLQLVCGSGLLEWVPVVKIRAHGFECEAVMGGLVMCQPCRDRFKWEDVTVTPIWAALVAQFKEETGFEPAKRHCDLDWISAAEFFKETGTL